jgi:hypothetical protein
VVFQVEGATVHRDPPLAPPPRFVFLLLGNFPAGLVSASVRRPDFQTPMAGDWLWFTMHEGLAAVMWTLIGIGIDAGRFSLRREMKVFLWGRVVAVAFGLAIDVWRFAGLLEALFWLAFAIWGVGWCVLRGVNALRRLAQSLLC